MLVLSRKKGEQLIFGDGTIVVEVVDIRGDKVRIGVTAPKGMSVHRLEVFKAIKAGLPGNRQITERENDNGHAAG